MSSNTRTDALVLRPSTLPAVGKPGEVRVETGTDKLKKWSVAASAFAEISGGGGLGINYIDESDAETAPVNWAAYADAAQETPVDGTGGAPTVTITRSVSSPLRETGSFLITKDAADRQGEGVAYPFAIAAADLGRQLTISFEYAASSAFVAGEASDIRLWIYDVDNAVLIAPSTTWIGGASGKVLVTFNATDSVNYRLIYHVATVNASAWTFKYDTVAVGPQVATLGLAGSDLNSFDMVIEAVTATPTKATTKLVDQAYWWRVGPNMIIRYDYKHNNNAGAATGTGEYQFQLPAGYTAQKVYTSTDNTSGVVGAASARSGAAGTSSLGVVALAPDNISLRMMVGDETTAPGAIGSTAYSLTGSTVAYSFLATVPIVGWDANVTLNNGSTFNISSILANGTRVTGAAPTQLGEYRSYLRNGSAATFTETNGDPTAAPSIADGVKIYGGVTWAAGDTNNEPSRYEIFIGKNKHYRTEHYGTAGKTGNSDIATTILVNGPGSTVWGIEEQYDPTTGILSVFLPARSEYTASINAGRSSFGNASLTNAWFDIIVSENALAIGSEVPNAELHLTVATALSSNNTQVPYFANTITNTGGYDLTNDSSDGLLVKPLSAGKYEIHYEFASGSAEKIQGGIGKNLSDAQKDTNPNATFAATPEKIFGVCRLPSLAGHTNYISGTITLNLVIGDEITVLFAEATVSATAASFHMIKVND